MWYGGKGCKTVPKTVGAGIQRKCIAYRGKGFYDDYFSSRIMSDKAWTGGFLYRKTPIGRLPGKAAIQNL